MSKIRVGVVFGGQSPEHAVSLQSARNVVMALDPQKYEVILLGISPTGEWYRQVKPTLPDLQQQIALSINADPCQRVALVSHDQSPQLCSLTQQGPLMDIDVIFPVLHGPNGEDGTMQGLMRLANIPFVGSDVLATAVCMDKDVAKRLLQAAGIATAPCVVLRRSQLSTLDEAAILQTLGLPCFVKPANAGSSIGVSKVKEAAALKAAILQAFEYDSKILIEAFMPGREIECAVLGNDDPKASMPGEIIPQAEFYSYEAKYLDPDGARLIIPAQLSPQTVHAIQQTAIAAFQALGCEGMARVDFFLCSDGRLIVNELNTLPGFTQISMYPKLWEASGLGYTELLDTLIRLALERFDRQQSIIPRAV